MDTAILSLTRAVSLDGSYWDRVRLAAAERRAGLHNVEPVISAADLARFTLHISYCEETEEEYRHWVVQAATDEEMDRSTAEGLLYFYNHTHWSEADSFYFPNPNGDTPGLMGELFGDVMPHIARAAARLRGLRAQ